MKQPIAQQTESTAAPVADSDSARAIEDLRKAEERYRAIAEVVADWAYSLRVLPDGEPDLLWTNMDTARVVGYRPSDLDARVGWLDLVHPDDRGALRSHMAALLKGRTDVAEYRIVT